MWVNVKSLSRVRLFATPWTIAHQAPVSMGSSRQEYWSGLPFPSPGDLPDPGIEPRSPALQADALTSDPPWGIIHLPYISPIYKGYSLMIFSLFIELCHHCHNLILENFCHPKITPCLFPHWILHTQPPALGSLTNHLSASPISLSWTFHIKETI